MESANHFKDKKITVMGLGLLGGGVGDVAYLAEAGAELIVTDMQSETALVESLTMLAAYSGITYRLGGHDEADFKDRDMILVAPSVPLDSPYLEIARASGARLVGAAALFAELSGVPIIGITGTRGKSTTTMMIHHVLSVVTGENILLGGNVRGVSNLQLLTQVKPDAVAVMELDSWKLQGFGWAEISPQIAVFTNFMEDHLNYYQTAGLSTEAAMDAYFTDKANIFRYQEPSGVLITTPEVFARAKATKGLTLGQEVILADASVIPDDALLAMPGEHNRLNAALAYEALKALSLTDEEIWPALASFGGVEGRLQYLGEFDGIKIYNDNNSTTPAATIAGLQALGNDVLPNIVLIAGGSYKNLDPAALVPVIQQYCKAVFLLPGTGTDKLIPMVATIAKPGLHIEQVETLAGAVAAARSAAALGDIILFSPAFASFGMFKNEYDRNDQFMKLIRQYES